MTKRELIYMVLNIVDPSNSSHRFHPKQVEYAINAAYNQYVQSIPNYLYDEHEFWVREYTGQVTVLDATRDLYYLTLPAALVPMKPPSEAVRHIAGDSGLSGMDYIPCTETVWELMDGLFSHDTSGGTTAYIVRYDKIWFSDEMSVATTVRLVLAVPFSEFTDNETINMPSGDVDIIQTAIQILMNTQPMDQKNNNAK
jgi:hypothetical protein